MISNKKNPFSHISSARARVNGQALGEVMHGHAPPAPLHMGPTSKTANGSSRRLSLGLAHTCMQTRAPHVLSLSWSNLCDHAYPCNSTACAKAGAMGWPNCCRIPRSPRGLARMTGPATWPSTHSTQKKFQSGPSKIPVGLVSPTRGGPARKWPKELMNSNSSPFKHMKLHSFHPF
jgi:hypothetical protein